jgi:branched-chain amino acid transport system substrate-binding protein
MYKKFALLLLVLVVALSFTGCKKEAGTLKIGLEGPMTGDYAYEGQGFEKAVRLLADQTNAAGGLLGRQIELVVEDDAGDPTQAALVAQRLVDAKVVAVIGAYNSTATEPASAIYNEAGILHITPSSTATRLTEKGYQRFFPRVLPGRPPGVVRRQVRQGSAGRTEFRHPARQLHVRPGAGRAHQALRGAVGDQRRLLRRHQS